MSAAGLPPPTPHTGVDGNQNFAEGHHHSDFVVMMMAVSLLFVDELVKWVTKEDVVVCHMGAFPQRWGPLKLVQSC